MHGNSIVYQGSMDAFRLLKLWIHYGQMLKKKKDQCMHLDYIDLGDFRCTMDTCSFNLDQWVHSHYSNLALLTYVFFI